MSNYCEPENELTAPNCCRENDIENGRGRSERSDTSSTEPNCCDESKDVSEQISCPSCDKRGKTVNRTAPENLLESDPLERLGEGVIHFCATPDCETVYYTEAGQRFEKQDLSVRVGLKETEDPVPVCYCFDFTEGMIREEIEQTGETTIPERITQEIKEGNCQCETMNPQGTCCLGNVTKAVRRVRGRLSDAIA